MMKKTTATVLAFLLALVLTSCGGVEPLGLSEPIDLDDNSIVSEKLLTQLSKDGAIGVFDGTSDEFRYEWVIFGNEISDIHAVDLQVFAEPIDENAQNGADMSEVLAAFTFAEQEPFGFSAVLSIELPEKHACPTAIVYRDGEVLCGASVTGVDTTILNFSVSDPHGKFIVYAEYPTYADGMTDRTDNLSDDESKRPDDYLSESRFDDDSVSTDGKPSADGASLSSENDKDRINRSESDEYLSKDPDFDENSAFFRKNETENARPSEPSSSKQDSSRSDGYLSGTSSEQGTVYGNKNQAQHVETVSGNARPTSGDRYLSAADSSTSTVVKKLSGGAANRPLSDGSATERDEYLTDPVPEGKPLPVEPEDTEVDTNISYTCTLSIECSTIFNNLSMLDENKRELLPSDGVILAAQRVTFYEGESVYDVLARTCRENGIHMEASFTPLYNSSYIEGIGNLYEFDCGSLSGWTYRVNGWYPNYGCSRYRLCDGDTIEWRYTCDLGRDIGCDWLMSGE